MNDTQKRILEFFVARGFTPIQAAGIVGNLMQESGLRPDALNKGENAQGVAQWRGGRLQALDRFGGGRRDLDTQLGFILRELGTTEKRAGEKLKNAKTVRDATAAFIGYERPQGWKANNPMGGSAWEDRLRYARQALGQSAPAIGRSVARPSEQASQQTGIFGAMGTGGTGQIGAAGASAAGPTAPAAGVNPGTLFAALSSLGSAMGSQPPQQDQSQANIQRILAEQKARREAWAQQQGFWS